MTPDRLKLLQNMPIFGGVREDILEYLLKSAHILDIPKDAYIFREDDIGMSLFVLESGKCHVTKLLDGKEYIVYTFSAGDCFGEMAVMDMGPRSANVVAIEDCRAIELSQHHLQAIYSKDIEQFTIIQMNMGREVCRRLRKADRVLFTTRQDYSLLPIREPAGKADD